MSLQIRLGQPGWPNKKTSPRTHVRKAGVSTSLSIIMPAAAAKGIGFPS